VGTVTKFFNERLKNFVTVPTFKFTAFYEETDHDRPIYLLSLWLICYAKFHYQWTVVGKRWILRNIKHLAQKQNSLFVAIKMEEPLRETEFGPARIETVDLIYYIT
jgi:hypothetical protein